MSAVVFGIGGLLKANAAGAVILTMGRFLSGIAAGCAAVIVPIYINELAPPNYKGVFGAMTQISINLGILSSQVLGIFLEQGEQWRFILLAGGVIGLAQAVGLLFLPESPSSLIAFGDIEQARRELIRIRGTQDVDDELGGYQRQPIGQPEGTDNTDTPGERERLLEPGTEESVATYNTTPTGENDADLEAGPAPAQDSHQIGLLEFITKREYRAGFVVVAAVMLAQQLTGINAVVFYGVSILDDLFPDSSKYLNAAISAVNLLVTLGASTMFDSVSHKVLLLTSMGAMGVSSAVLGLSISNGLATLSAISTLLFVSAFSMGLGPLPWMVASSRIQPQGVGAAQAIALTANWLGTFIVSFAVPVIANAAGMPAVFYIFVILSFAFFVWGFLSL
ncbi:major facilitator superfamily domain-containing protein [Tuber brumale]|nr:major facilitator superfamily domain-containing protein [Tuber brumale]KAG0644476.1 major facilitator superfamily domain-containing protein [Tuber brumale]